MSLVSASSGVKRHGQVGKGSEGSFRIQYSLTAQKTRNVVLRHMTTNIIRQRGA